jgi:hypothetical protein
VNPRPRAWVVGLGLALFAALTAARVLVADGDELGAVVFAPPVALLALELGALTGTLAGAAGAFVFYVTAAGDISTWDLAFRALALLTLGALVGMLGSQLRAARAVVQTAAVINDNVIQSLVLAKYALERGDVPEARSRIDETLHEAREIIDGLVEPQHVRAGDLRREQPARVR